MSNPFDLEAAQSDLRAAIIEDKAEWADYTALSRVASKWLTPAFDEIARLRKELAKLDSETDDYGEAPSFDVSEETLQAMGQAIREVIVGTIQEAMEEAGSK